jgi:hypothetical protein
MSVCTCSTGATGMQVLDCFGQPDRITGIAFVDLMLDSTTANSIQVTEALPLTLIGWTGRLYNKDEKQRFSVLNDIKVYARETADAVTEEIDTIPLFIRDGDQMVTFELIGAPAAIKAAIETLRCRTVGYYGLTASNQLVGYKVSDTSLQPIPIEKGTLSVKTMDRTNNTVSRVMVSFMVKQSYNAANTGFIPSTAIVPELSAVPGMIQATATTTGAATTTATTQVVSLTWSLSGSAASGTQEALVGFDTTTFWSIFNEDTALAVTVATCVENPDGTYTLGFSAQTTGDVLRFSATNTAPFNFTPFTKTAA